MKLTAQLCDVSGEPLPYEWSRIQTNLYLDDLIRDFDITCNGNDLYAEKGGEFIVVFGTITAEDCADFHTIRFTDNDGCVIDQRAVGPYRLAPGSSVEIEYSTVLPPPSDKPIDHDQSPLMCYLKPHLPRARPSDQDPVWDAVKRFSHG